MTVTGWSGPGAGAWDLEVASARDDVRPTFTVAPTRIEAGASATIQISACVAARCGFCTSTGRCAAVAGAAACPAGDLASYSGDCPGFCAAHGGSCADCAAQVGCGWCRSGDACLWVGPDGHRPPDTCTDEDWFLVPTYCV